MKVIITQDTFGNVHAYNLELINKISIVKNHSHSIYFKAYYTEGIYFTIDCEGKLVKDITPEELVRKFYQTVAEIQDGVISEKDFINLIVDKL